MNQRPLLAFLLLWATVLAVALDPKAQLQCITTNLVLGSNTSLAEHLKPSVVVHASTSKSEALQAEEDALEIHEGSALLPEEPFHALNALLAGSAGHLSTSYQRCEYGVSFEEAWYFDVSGILGPSGLVVREAEVIVGCLSRVLQHARFQRRVLWSYNTSGARVGCFLVRALEPLVPAEEGDVAALVAAYFTAALAVPLATNECAEAYGAASVVLHTEMACPAVPLGTDDTYWCLGNCIPLMDQGACCGAAPPVASVTSAELPFHLRALAVVVWVAAGLLLIAVVAYGVVVYRICSKQRGVESISMKRFNAGDFKSLEVASATASALIMGLKPYIPCGPATTCAICQNRVGPTDNVKSLDCGHACHTRCLGPYVCNKVRFYDALRCPDCGAGMFPGGDTPMDDDL